MGGLLREGLTLPFLQFQPAVRLGGFNMEKYLRVSCTLVAIFALVATAASARPAGQRHEVADPALVPDIVGDVEGTLPAAQKTLQDTVWIADWGFDAGFPCADFGWQRADNRILNNGVVHWSVTASYTGTGGITGKAAVLGYSNNACCAEPTGYDNDWYQAVRITYSGSGFVSFDYLVDSEAGYDFLQVETDSACASFARVDYAADPAASTASFRNVEFADSGFDAAGHVDSVAMTNFGNTGTHCLYIAFFSDGGYAPCDGFQATSIGAALVVDNIALVGITAPLSETFEAALNPRVSFLTIQDSRPFGEWARVFQHITDNDLCTENKTCAWLWTDYITPTIANDPSMSFAPEGYVVRNWLDDIIISPWVSLASTPTASGTVLQFRRFPGNFFAQSRIVQNWSVRGKSTVNSQTCLSTWGHAFQWNSLSFFGWQTLTFDMTTSISPTAASIQVRHRTSDWQWLVGVPPPTSFVPGPGPFIDRTRIGRRILSGPVFNEGIDSRSQAQDAYPTEIHPGVTPAGEHFRPTTDRFGTTALSGGTELGINNTSPNLITGDSIWVEVRDSRSAGGITSVDWYGAIVAGPHVGKAPAPWAVGANGFFQVPADSVRSSNGAVLDNFWFVDLDDTYFRGGDVLYYFWLSQDALGGVSSNPIGMNGVPASVDAAQAATKGVHEVSFLPAITWSPAYLARISADAHGDLDPTAEELAASSQSHCILYVQMVNTRRRAGLMNRTSFMYTLDRLGYRGHYDVYDHQGLGNTNNHLGGRATTEQAQGYNLIVYDVGNSGATGWMMPDGSDLDLQKIDQAGWFRTWLAQASLSQAQFATLWVVGANVLQEKPTNPLFVTDMGVVLNASTQSADPYPLVRGAASFTFRQNNMAPCTANFTGDEYRADGGCPLFRDYDALDASGGGVVTHQYRDPRTAFLNSGAIVMKGNAAESWNTIHQTHTRFDIAQKPGSAPTTPTPTVLLAQKILNCVLPVSCLQGPTVTDVPETDELAVPRQTTLFQNVPNPFNPATTIRFDLAADGHVALRIYDVAGRLVRTLIDAPLAAGFGQSATWDGLDAAGNRASSGVYFYRLEAAGHRYTRKMVVMK